MRYNRILLKLSGESLKGQQHIIDPKSITTITDIVARVYQTTQLGIVVGGGNILRGRDTHNITNIVADYMGMTATFINALALVDALNNKNIKAVHISASAVDLGVSEPFNLSRVNEYIANNIVVVFSLGTGNPCVTTDTAAVLRSIEINAELIVKATNVDGVYSKDPKIHKDAIKYDNLSFDEALSNKLKVMDLQAFSLCRDYNKKIVVANILQDNNTLINIINNKKVGTLISS